MAAQKKTATLGELMRQGRKVFEKPVAAGVSDLYLGGRYLQELRQNIERQIRATGGCDEATPPTELQAIFGFDRLEGISAATDSEHPLYAHWETLRSWGLAEGLEIFTELHTPFALDPPAPRCWRSIGVRPLPDSPRGAKRPRLFYFEETEGAWCPSPDSVHNLIDLDSQLEDGEEVTVRFRRVDMSDEELLNLPDI